MWLPQEQEKQAPECHLMFENAVTSYSQRQHNNNNNNYNTLPLSSEQTKPVRDERI